MKTATALDRLALQCGRIYKDAEIKNKNYILQFAMKGFNVAASIKMRKSLHRTSRRLEFRGASMWPHL